MKKKKEEEEEEEKRKMTNEQTFVEQNLEGKKLYGTKKKKKIARFNQQNMFLVLCFSNKFFPLLKHSKKKKEKQKNCYNNQKQQKQQKQ